jgi:uncharacterized surface protein with fasciclin (FAS1) repeats
MKNNFVLGLALVALAVTSALAGMKNPMVGGHEMYPTENILENAMNSADHTTLVVAVKAAGLVDTLSGAGPFTVFAPTNEAFAKLPAGTVDTLLKPENRHLLTRVLTYHVLAGRVSAADLKVDHGGWRQAVGNGEEWPHRLAGREGRNLDSHDSERVPVEWRDPHRRHRCDAQLVAQPVPWGARSWLRQRQGGAFSQEDDF